MSDNNQGYKVKANEFEFNLTAEQLALVDLVKRPGSEYNLIKDHRSINAKIISVDKAAKQMHVEIDGDSFDVTIKDELDQVLEKMGFDKSSVKHIKDIKAPMPGLVLEISVSEGQSVTEGDKVLILQAMKMENSIMIQTNAVIKHILVTPGQAVEKGQVLIELE